LCPSCNKKRRQERVEDFDGDRSTRTERSSSNEDRNFDYSNSSKGFGYYLKFFVLLTFAVGLIYFMGFYPGGPAIFLQS